MLRIYRQNLMPVKLTTLTLLVSMFTPVFAIADAEIEKDQCRVLGKMAFKVMISYQTSDADKSQKENVGIISKEDWSEDIISSGLRLLASQVDRPINLDEKFAVSEKFETIIEEKCLEKKLGPLQQYINQIDVPSIKLEAGEVSKESRSILPLLKDMNDQIYALKAENEKLRSMILATYKDQPKMNFESIVEIEQSLIELSAASEVLQEGLVDVGVRGSSIEYRVNELDERMLFTEQDLDAITAFRQETNRKLNQLQEQIRTLQYSQ